MQLVKWDSITEKFDTKAGYSEFHRIVRQKNNAYLPCCEWGKPYYNDNMKTNLGTLSILKNPKKVNSLFIGTTVMTLRK